MSDTLNDISREIIGCAFEIRNLYGRLMLESLYERVMEVELNRRGLTVERQVPLSINHKEVVIPNAYYIDMVVNGQVAIEFKAMQYMGGDEFRQLMTYLKLSGLKLGLLINFGARDFGFGRFDQSHRMLNRGIYRIANGL